jgi:hypothetical protein
VASQGGARDREDRGVRGRIGSHAPIHEHGRLPFCQALVEIKVAMPHLQVDQGWVLGRICYDVQEKLR